jgi:hypothetical protein
MKYLRSQFEEVIQDIDKVFNMFDLDGNETLDKNELRAAVQELGMKNLTN